VKKIRYFDLNFWQSLSKPNFVGAIRVPTGHVIAKHSHSIIRSSTTNYLYWLKKDLN